MRPPPSVPRARARAQLGAEAAAKADMDLLSTNIEEGEQSISRSGRRRRTKGGGAGDAGAGAEVELGGELSPGTAAAEALRAEMAAAAMARLVDAELDLLEAEAEVDAAVEAEHARGSSGRRRRTDSQRKGGGPLGFVLDAPRTCSVPGILSCLGPRKYFARKK